MKNVFASLQPFAFALFRFCFGLFYFQHATQKFLGWPNALGFPLPMMKAAGCIELMCGLLIMIGLFTPYAAFLASGEMASAYFIAHFPHGFWPLTNGGEPPVLFCFAFLLIATQGAGLWSVDALLRKGRVTDSRQFKDA